ncbi:MAG: hypothetical protein ACOC2C_06610 [Cyclonatronaceae bacterium]
MIKLKRQFQKEGAFLPVQDAVNMLFQGGFFPEVARAVAFAETHKMSTSINKLQIHAQSGGRPLEVVKALHYVQHSGVEAVRLSFRHLCLIDLSGQALLPLIKEAEHARSITVEGVLGFSSHKYDYVYEARYRRPLLALAFDSFSEEEICRELRRKLGDLHRYHKELLRIDAQNPEAIRRHLLENVLRPAFWERNFNLLLVGHELHLQARSHF